MAPSCGTMDWTVWEGECSGLFDRKNGAFFTHSEDVVRAMVKAVFSDDASYTLDTVYQTAP